MCNFTEHSFCVANIITAFANIDCDCPAECDAESYSHSNMQYAELELNSPNHYHLRHNSNETGMCSILIYQADRIVVDNEQPDRVFFWSRKWPENRK